MIIVLLIDGRLETINEEDLECVDDEMVRPRVSRLALNRWLVAYTLIRNEQLMEYRRGNWGRV
jgi:hypothetical protein